MADRIASIPATGLAISEDDVFADFAARVDLTGSIVAEIGGSMPLEEIVRQGVDRWYSVDPNRAPGVEGAREIIAAPAERMPLPDASVDAVFSCNAFQFIDVPASLEQVRRVLRPGGTLYAHFGPIWSAADGHQLEYVSYRGRPLTFWDDTLLPPWSHLAYGREELRTLLRSGLPEDLADLLVRHVHDSDTINRLFFEDYVLAALGSGLDWIEVGASDVLDYPIVTPEYDPALRRDIDLGALAAELTRLRQRPTRLGPRDVRMVLRKPAGPPATVPPPPDRGER
jgi:SAM-dependent methyltransferase